VGTLLVGYLEFGDVAVFSADADELEEVLEECDEFIFAFAVGEKEGEEDGEVAGPDEDFLCYLFREVFGGVGVLGEVAEGRYVAQ
jgi:hypothetical protein